MPRARLAGLPGIDEFLTDHAKPHRLMQGQVSTTYVRLLYEFLAREGLDGTAVLGEPPPPDDDLGLGRYPIQHWVALLERAQSRLGRPALGLSIGALIAPRHFGVLGYVTQHCATLGEALLRLRDLERLVYEVSPGRLELDGQAVQLVWGQEAGRPGQLADETALAALVSYARAIAQTPVDPLRVDFINPAPADVSPYRAFFRCPVRFDQPLTIVRLPASALALPLKQPDAALRELLDQQARRLLTELPQGSALLGRLRPLLTRQLREGTPKLATAAAALHLSPRSLQRQLAAEGRGFQDVLDELRCQLAEDYLRDPRLQLSEVAALLGYAEQAAFTRAFRRWKGRSPRQWRREASQKPAIAP